MLLELTSFSSLLGEVKDLVGCRDDLAGIKLLEELARKGGRIADDVNSISRLTFPSFRHLIEESRQRATILRSGTRLKDLREDLRKVGLDLTAALSSLTA